MNEFKDCNCPVEVEISLTYKQHKWLSNLAEDLRTDLSGAIACCINQHVEAHERNPLNPASYLVRRNFGLCVRNQSKSVLSEAEDLLAELALMLRIAHKECELVDLRVELEQKGNLKRASDAKI